MIRVTNMMRSTDIHCHSRLSLSVFNPSSPVHCQHVYGSTLDSRMSGAVTYGEGAGSESVNLLSQMKSAVILLPTVFTELSAESQGSVTLTALVAGID